MGPFRSKAVLAWTALSSATGFALLVVLGGLFSDRELDDVLERALQVWLAVMAVGLVAAVVVTLAQRRGDVEDRS
jgi:uncharacterized membrane protein YdcZ (DUF606 family)